jgi:NitT/TauT family transport system substrate-binding protein
LNKKKIITIIALLVVFLIFVGAIIGIKVKNTSRESVSDTEIKKISVMEVTRSVFYAPQYVALSEGFFEDEGLEIDLTTGSGADSVMTAVLSDQVDIGFAGPEAAIYVYNEGSTNYPKVFAQLTKRDGSFLISRTEQENFNWENVKDSVIIPGRVGGVPNMTLQYVLRKHGINPETDVKLDTSISFDLMAGAFSAGNADYVTLFEPTASATENAQAGYIVASVGAETEEVTYTTYFATSDYIYKNSETIEKFKNAINKGLEWTHTHTAEEIADSISEYFPDTDRSLLITVIQNYSDIDSWNKTTKVSESGFELLQTIMQQAGQLENRVNYGDVVIQ